MDLSVVIPLFNEEESLEKLADWIEEVLKNHHFSYEILFVDDGSKDGSWQVLKNLCQKSKHIKAIRFRRNFGKSAALNEAFRLVQGDVVATMDADLQDSPEELPELYDMIKKEDYDLVSGWKKKRKDPVSKTIPTKLFNAVTRKVSGIELHDFNCGLKAYRLEVVQNIEVYGEMHRYIPVIAKWAGFTKIGEKQVRHQERKHGTSKFGTERFINGFLDLMSIYFTTQFGKKPMHFFGALGTLSFFIGSVVTLWIIGDKIYQVYFGIVSRDVTDQPLFYLAITAVIIGVQLFLAGFLGELISRNSPERNKYQIRETTGFQS